jgi:hypothetical protein
MHNKDPSKLCEEKREYETHFEGDTPYTNQRTYNKEHPTTNKVYNSITMSVQQLIYTRIYTCTCNSKHMYVQHKYVNRIKSLTLIVISHSFPSTYRLYTSIEKVIHTELFQCFFFNCLLLVKNHLILKVYLPFSLSQQSKLPSDRE